MNLNFELWEQTKEQQILFYLKKKTLRKDCTVLIMGKITGKAYKTIKVNGDRLSK